MNKDTQSWSNSNLTEMEELLQKVQQLERENAALREQIAALGEIAVLNYDDDTVGKCDAITGGGEKYKDVMRGLFVDQPRENAALRSLVQHWYKLVPENIRSSIEDAQKETKP